MTSGTICPLPYGIYNVAGAINDYCGTPLTDSSYGGTAPNPISCATVVFYVEGEGVTGAIVGGESVPGEDVYIAMSWGPFVLPWTDGEWQEESFSPANSNTITTLVVFYELIPATESFTYSFPSHLICTTHPWPAIGNVVPTSNCAAMGQPLYTCLSGCSGTVTLAEGEHGPFVVTYSPLVPPTIPPTGVPQFPLGFAILFALAVPSLLLLRKRALSPRSLGI